MKVASIAQTKPAKRQKIKAAHDTFKVNNDLNKSVFQCQRHSNNSIKGSSKRQDSSRVRIPKKAVML